MSVEAMALVLHHSKASGTAKVVLLGIANHAGDGGAWPSLATLAKYANVTPRNVMKAIGKLVELGEVIVDSRGGGLAKMKDHWRPNLYHVQVTCPNGCDRSPNHRVSATDESDRGVVSNSTGGVLSQATDEPSSEPSEEPSTGSRGASAGSPRGERAQDPRIPRQRRKPKRKPLTPDERTASYRRFCAMDLTPLEADPEAYAAAFVDLENRFDAFEPDKWAKSKLDKDEWETFVGSVGLGDDMTFEWGGRQVVRA